MKEFAFDCGIISVVVLALGSVLAALEHMKKCENCGHDKGDHIENTCCGGDFEFNCDCRGYK